MQTRSKRLALVLLLAGFSYAVAVFQHDFLRRDVCLDSGGAWDVRADTCVHDEGIGALLPSYPRWVFLSASTLSVGIFVVACAAVAGAVRRRWSRARVLGRVSVLSAAALCVGTLGLVMLAATADVPLTSSKAARLGKTIADFMNATSGIYFGAPMGLVAWAIGAWAERRERRAATA